MEQQGWKALNAAEEAHLSAAERGEYDVQSTYVPAEPSSYSPPKPEHHDKQDNPFSGSLTGAEPADVAPATTAAAPHTLEFQGTRVAASNLLALTVNTHEGTCPSHAESNLPAYSVTGKIGNDVPRVQPYGAGGGGARSPAASGRPDGAGGDDGAGPTTFAFYNLKRYRRYFNVDTEDVLVRMRDSVTGIARPDFLDKTAESADLYGPFWVTTTLVFLSAVAGNYASYVSYRRSHAAGSATGSELPAWFYDIDKVGYSAILFYGYVGVVGLALFLVLKWAFKSSIGLAQVWCTYGYALSVFIPVSCLCVLPYEAVRWTAMAVATLTSGLFLLLNFRGPIFEVAGAKALPVWIAMGLLHIGLGLALKLYVFQYWAS